MDTRRNYELVDSDKLKAAIDKMQPRQSGVV